MLTSVSAQGGLLRDFMVCAKRLPHAALDEYWV